METTAPSTPARTPAARVIGLSAGLAVIVGVITLAFAWPSADMGPHELPIAVIGPEAVAEQVQSRLDEARPDGFDVTVAGDAAAAEALIEEREVYAALAVTPEGVTAYTASAASPAVARLVTGIAEQIAAQTGQTAGTGGVQVAVEDVVALPADDPNGVGLAASSLPLAMGGLLVAALIGLTVRGTARQIAVALLAPPAVGASVAAVLLYVLGSLEGDFTPVAGALALAMAATAWTVLGLVKLLGRAGLAVGAVIVMLIGNPLSGMTSAPELLPEPWGALGQYLTPGAGGTLLRSAAYFDGHGASTAVWVLGAWIVAGAVLFIAGAARARVRRVEAAEPEPVAAAV